ncbi:hypothetical protein [Actinomadura harenae]|uniref:Uncharacterized protein n=1 Tax=Actinomadura harenae TaxID=2483351 RepID=A0A3M2LJR8_9ACTN|nr:hypothetical protein [Actinomadura harenae]RMI37727.1 hypothetical protein EBO15_35015 [Actinomadura harenae]
MKFEFTEDALKRLAEAKVREVSRDFDKLVEQLTSQMRGRPVDEIKLVLQRKWKRVADGDLRDPLLTKIA